MNKFHNTLTQHGFQHKENPLKGVHIYDSEKYSVMISFNKLVSIKRNTDSEMLIDLKAMTVAELEDWFKS